MALTSTRSELKRYTSLIFGDATNILLFYYIQLRDLDQTFPIKSFTAKKNDLST